MTIFWGKNIEKTNNEKKEKQDELQVLKIIFKLKSDNSC
jgi:hypothetical protein